MPSPPPPSPPYLSIILPQSSPTATVTPPIMCPLGMSAKACFYFCVIQRRILTCTLFCKCAMLTSGLHVAQGIFCCVRVLMEIMRLPTRAWRRTKDCLLWVTDWACANAIWPHEINGKTLYLGRQTRGHSSLILALLILHVFVWDGGFFKNDEWLYIDHVSICTVTLTFTGMWLYSWATERFLFLST